MGDAADDLAHSEEMRALDRAMGWDEPDCDCDPNGYVNMNCPFCIWKDHIPNPSNKEQIT